MFISGNSLILVMQLHEKKSLQRTHHLYPDILADTRSIQRWMRAVRWRLWLSIMDQKGSVLFSQADLGVCFRVLVIKSSPKCLWQTSLGTVQQDPLSLSPTKPLGNYTHTTAWSIALLWGTDITKWNLPWQQVQAHSSQHRARWYHDYVKCCFNVKRN